MARPKSPRVPPSESVRARLIGLGGQRSDGSPDVKGIAARLERSPRTVQRYLASDRLPKVAESHVSSLEAADARKPKWISATDEGPTARALMGGRQPKMPAVQDVRGSLSTRYQRADGSIDTRRAAGELGVSQRTVQRWAKGESRPKLASQESLRGKVRESLLDTKRGARLANKGATVELTAVVDVSGDVRQRSLGKGAAIKLSGQDMDNIAKAYAQGGDKAATAALAQAVGRSSYVQQIIGQSRGNVSRMAMKDISEVRFT